jgi:hypothetical protein
MMLFPEIRRNEQEGDLHGLCDAAKLTYSTTRLR